MEAEKEARRKLKVNPEGKPIVIFQRNGMERKTPMLPTKVKPDGP